MKFKTSVLSDIYLKSTKRIYVEFLYIVCVKTIIISIIVIIWARPVARMEEVRSAFKIFTGKPTGKRPLGRPRRRWEGNIRMYLKEIGINLGIV